MQRGKVPIVVGGTGFYLRWCLHGKPQTPSSTAQGVTKAQNFIKEVRPDRFRFTSAAPPLVPKIRARIDRNEAMSLMIHTTERKVAYNSCSLRYR